MCMLLMGCGSAGGFNPLSLNPTLWALPENSFSRTGAQFTAASSQYLSVNNNTLLKPNGSDMAFAFWYKMDSTSTNSPIVGRWGASSNTDYLLSVSESGFARWRWGGTLLSTAIATLGTDTTGVWHFGFAWYDSGTNKIYFQFNNGTIYSTTVTSPPSGNTNNFIIGRNEQVATGPTWFLNGSLDNFLAFQPPTSLGDGTSGSLAHTIATALYNSGNGLAFQDITSAQETDWGIVSGWLDNSLTADAFGSNTLTNNNGVTQAAGKVNAVAVDNDPTYFVNDASTNDNDLTQVLLANRPLYKSAGYWTFDGINDSLEVADIGSVSYPFALISLFKLTNTTAVSTLLSYGTLNNEFNLLVAGGFLYATSQSSVANFARVLFSDTANWHIAVAVFEAINNRTVYLDGSSSANDTASNSVIPASNLFKIGKRLSGGAESCHGSIADVMLLPNYTTEKLNAYGNYLVAKYPSLSLSWTDI